MNIHEYVKYVGWGEGRTPTVVLIQPQRVGVRKLTPTYTAEKQC